MNDFIPSPKTLASIVPNALASDSLAELLVSDVQTDSREVSPGSLFIAVSGGEKDGEDFIPNAIENGAVAVLVEDGHQSEVLHVEVPVIGVKNLRQQVSEIAARFYASDDQQALIYGVTGTNGKSTITSMIAQLHQLTGDSAAMVGTLGYGFVGQTMTATGMTTPDKAKTQRILAELKSSGAKCIAMEVSSHGIDQQRIANIVFDVAVMSNITHDHLDYHGSFSAYAKVKKSFLLSDDCLAAVINLDDAECSSVSNLLRKKKTSVITYSIGNSTADVCACVKSINESGFEVEIASPWGKASARVPLIGMFNLSNLLAAISSLCVTGKSFLQLVEKIDCVRPVEGRLQEVTLGDRKKLPRVFVDFAHTPDALSRVLSALRAHTSGKICVVFGCGGDRDKAKRPAMGAIAAEAADQLVVTSDNPRTEDPLGIIEDILAGIPQSATSCESKISAEVDRKKAIYSAISGCRSEDTVLIAGKGHEDYQILGAKKLPFSDALVARNALNNRLSAQQVST